MGAKGQADLVAAILHAHNVALQTLKIDEYTGGL
jgi:hypothetical protein